ncbi:MAG: carboxypeptidase-like regulatory domain-containing protein [Ferruginibacter sp.]
MRTIAFLSLLSVILFISCKKDINNDSTNQPVDSAYHIPAATPVTGSVSGLIVNENNAPVPGAEVKCGSFTSTTDASGRFNFTHITLDKYISTITVTSTGYFKGYRSFAANATRNYVVIKLIPKALTGSINSSSGGTVSLPNGTVLSLASNSVVDKATGAPYNGSVNAYAAYIDPTSNDISATVPGSFLGKDANNLYALQSTGMVAVELESSDGHSLQLAANMPATIKVPVPASLTSKAPATIDTWSLNEAGVWEKEGTAQKSGNFYEMQATHFSFWNLDVPTNAVYLNMHVQDDQGNALTNTLVSLTVPNSSNWWTTTHGYTDSLGNVSGFIPANMELQLNVFANAFTCATPLNSQTIGPFSSNPSITVTVALTPIQTLTVTGTANGCNGQPLPNGSAIINAGLYNYTIATVVNGNYTATIPICNVPPSVNVTVLDNTNGAQGISGDVTVSGNSVTIPAVTACGNIQDAVWWFGGVSPSNDQADFSVAGFYHPGTALTSANTVKILVYVSTIGAYSISTTSENGISYSGSGVFTTIGANYAILTGTGTPTSTGYFVYTTQSTAPYNCNFAVRVNSAVIDLGTGACTGVVLGGTYVANYVMLPYNTATITVNVISPGTYYISTESPNQSSGGQTNGMQFVDSGTFVNTGMQTVVLSSYRGGHGGGAENAGTFNYTAQSTSSINPGCTFNVTAVALGPRADITFAGMPSSCVPPVITGTYFANTELTAQNTVTILVDVATTGSYLISTDNVNGVDFSAAGEFTTTGVQSLELHGRGVQGGPPGSTNYFAPESWIGSVGQTGCTFPIQFN